MLHIGRAVLVDVDDQSFSLENGPRNWTRGGTISFRRGARGKPPAKDNGVIIRFRTQEVEKCQALLLAS